MEQHAVTLAFISSIWYAQRKKDVLERQQELEAKEKDPLPWTTLQVFLVLPAIYGGLSWLEEAGVISLQAKWRDFYSLYSLEELIEIAYLFNACVYFGVGFSFLFVDLVQPAFLYKYKIQKKAVINYRVMLPKLFLVLSMNNLLPLFGYFLLPKARYEYLRHSFARFQFPFLVRTSPTLPSFFEYTSHVFIFLMVYDVLFFYSHKFLHRPFFYRYIHKLHHQWTAPTALAAAYAHPIEHIISNLAPAIVTLILCRPHYLTFCSFTTLGLIITLFEHSGYDVWRTFHFHDLHHQNFINNYSTFGFWDNVYECRTYFDTTAEKKKQQ